MNSEKAMYERIAGQIVTIGGQPFVDLEAEWGGEPLGDWGSIQNSSAVTEWREA